MNFIFALLYFNIFVNVSGNTFYRSISSCVSKPLQINDVSSEIHCAVTCQTNDCLGFLYDENKFLCNLYKFDGFCLSKPTCRNVKIFVADKYYNQLNVYLITFIYLFTIL